MTLERDIERFRRGAFFRYHVLVAELYRYDGFARNGAAILGPDELEWHLVSGYHTPDEALAVGAQIAHMSESRDTLEQVAVSVRDTLEHYTLESTNPWNLVAGKRRR